MSNKETRSYFIFSWSWQYGDKHGNGSSTRWFSGFNGKIGKKSLERLKNDIIEGNPEIFKNMTGDSFIFFISSISLLGEMTEEEFENE